MKCPNVSRERKKNRLDIPSFVASKAQIVVDCYLSLAPDITVRDAEQRTKCKGPFKYLQLCNFVEMIRRDNTQLDTKLCDKTQNSLDPLRCVFEQF